MITTKQKNNIQSIIINLKRSEVLWLNDLLEDEVIYLKQLIMSQNGSKGFCIELNDNHTKIRKLKFERI